MKQYSVYTKLDGHIGKFSGGGSDVTKAYVDKQLETKANKTELAEYAKTTEVTKTVSSEIAKVIADAPASFDTLKEIADWIDTHEDSASAMNTAIQKNTADISSLQISKANSTDLTAHTDNSDIHVTLEEKNNFHTHTNKAYLDKISENSSGNLTYNGKEITGGSTITDISDCTVNTIEEVKDRTPISATDKMKLIVGKIVKTFADIKNIAFSGSISDITDFNTVLSTSLLSTESGKRALDESVGKILNDKIEEMKNLQGSTDISAIGDGSVTGALSTLNSNLTRTVKPVGNATLEIYGKLCILQYNNVTYTNTDNVPEEYRPKCSFPWATATCGNDIDNTSSYRITVSPNGAVGLQKNSVNIPSLEELRCQLCWII